MTAVAWIKIKMNKLEQMQYIFENYEDSLDTYEDIYFLYRSLDSCEKWQLYKYKEYKPLTKFINDIMANFMKRQNG
jgi:hypothetical protein